jgi:hypothetical protein
VSGGGISGASQRKWRGGGRRQLGGPAGRRRRAVRAGELKLPVGLPCSGRRRGACGGVGGRWNRSVAVSSEAAGRVERLRYLEPRVSAGRTADLDGGDGLHEALLAAGPQVGEALAQAAVALRRRDGVDGTHGRG